MFYCGSCWKKWKHERIGIETLERRGHGEVVDDKMSPECVAQSYEQLDPVWETRHYNTEISFRESHCFDIASAQGDACLVALGSNFHIEPPGLPNRFEMPPRGILYRLCQASSFQKNVTPPLECVVVPKWGGIYAPHVDVFMDSEGKPVPKFQNAVLYAACPWGPAEDENGGEARFKNEMREKMLNVLRICHKHEQSKLIIG